MADRGAGRVGAGGQGPRTPELLWTRTPPAWPRPPGFRDQVDMTTGHYPNEVWREWDYGVAARGTVGARDRRLGGTRRIRDTSPAAKQTTE